jgi:septum formation protein
MERIILASQSPRRRELLTEMGAVFTAIPSNYDEHLDDARSIEEVAIELSLGKAMDVALNHPDAYVIGSDTIVGIDNRQLGKAETVEEARAMHMGLVGRQSVVTTGLAVVHLSKGIEITDVDTAQVFFKPDSADIAKLREEYLASDDWRDKAGAYSVQKLYGSLIERVEGDFTTIVGLPSTHLAGILNDLGFEDVQPVVIEP